MFITNNHNSFYLWSKKNLVKHKKVSKYYDQDCNDLVKKTDNNTKINEIEKKITDHNHSKKHITTQEFDK